MEDRVIKILAIDDNPDNLFSIKALLNELFPNANIFTAENGSEGLEIAEKEDPDVVLLDIVMPDLDGYEVCKRLKEDELLKGIPVVFITALGGDKESRLKAFEVGAEGFLSKPIDETELYAHVKTMVKIKEAYVQKVQKEKILIELVDSKTNELMKVNQSTLNLLEDLKRENEARRKSEVELKKSQLQYQNLVSKIPIGVYQLLSKPDSSFKFIFVSERMSEITGVASSIILEDPMTAFMAFHPEDLQEFTETNKEIIEKKIPYGWTGRLLVKGEIKWIHIASSPEPQENGDVLWHGLMIDITERQLRELEINKKNEELLKINAEKDKFYSIIAHDLRNPINGFLALTMYLDDSLLEMPKEEIAKVIGTLKKASKNLHYLTHNLLEWAALQKGLSKPDFRSFLLREKTDEIIETISDQFSAKNISLYNQIDESLNVFADKNMFASILRNLISNAIKYTPRGGSITLFAKSRLDNFVELCVEDTGIGMVKEMKDKLFQINEQVTRTGTSGELSTGLGLIICKEFIDLQGGKIWVESEEGKGSTFCFTIPREG